LQNGRKCPGDYLGPVRLAGLVARNSYCSYPGANMHPAHPDPARTLLRGGLVADGVAEVTRRADVLVDGPVIAGLIAGGDPPAECAVIDLAPGSVICPGFIDAHVHAEGPVLAAGRVDGALAQGVTTLVIGQDGQSWVGATAATAQYLNEYFAPVNGALEPARDLSVADFRAAVSGRLAQNVAVLASQGTIRHNVAGLTRGPLTPPQRAAARRAVEQALADGAVGLSSGLDYLPSRFGDVAEMTAIAAPLAAAGRPYVSHLRAYGPQAGSGLAELAAVGAGTGTRVHASHLWGAPTDLQAAFASAAAAGVALSCDMYPYRRSSTVLAMLLLPPDLQAGGPAATLAALADRGQRAGLLAGPKFTDDFLRDVYLGDVPPRYAQFAGQAVTRAAAGRAPSAGEWVLDLLAAARLRVGAHLDRRLLADDHLAWLAAADRMCAGSDGIYQGQHPHPRGYGAFARLAGHYLAADPVRGHQRAARHLAANAAAVYGLRDRGRIAPGLAADLCVIGPGGLTERATYAAPQVTATGISLVMVNGVVAWQDGQPRAGRWPGAVVS
jgi:N-acyl-D-amino-acid deacylase